MSSQPRGLLLNVYWLIAATIAPATLLISLTSAPCQTFAAELATVELASSIGLDDLAQKDSPQ